MSQQDRRAFLKRGGAVLGVGAALTTSGVLAREHVTSERVSGYLASAQDELPPTREAAEGDWVEYRAGPGNTGAIPAAPGVDPSVHGCSCFYDGPFAGEPAIVDDTMYLVDSPTGGRIVAVDARDGSVEWTGEDVAALATPAVGYDRIFASAHGEGTAGELVALDVDDGSLEWSIEFESRPTVPTVAYETVYVVGHETLYAVDVADGSIRWERDLDATFDAYSTPPAVGGGQLYVITDGPMYAFDPLTGEERWRTEDEDFFTDGGQLRATDDRVSVRVLEANTPVYDAETGKKTHDLPGRRSALDDEVLTRTTDEALVTYRFEDDDSWEFPGTELSQPTIAGDEVYVYVGDDPDPEYRYNLVALDKDDGSARWSCEVEPVDNPNYVSVAATTDAVYVIGDDEIHAVYGTHADHEH